MNMYSLKGFMGYPQLSNNAAGQVAPIGELSPIALTYAPERQFYQSVDDTTQRAILIAFLSTDDTNGDVPVASIYGDQAIDVGNYVLQSAQNSTFTTDNIAAATNMATHYADTLTDISVGPMVAVGLLYFPSWIQYTQIANDEGVDGNTVRIWFSDDAFKSQYDEYSLRIIPPFQALDEFFESFATIQTEASEFSVTDLMSRIQNTAESQPYTYVRSYSYDYVYPTNPALRISTWWTVIEYGISGDNLDAIKAAIVTYILANSTHSRDEWAQIFPDIFLVTEFILTPRWDQFAIPNKTLQPGLYSPVLDYDEALMVAKMTGLGVGYTAQTVESRLNIMPMQYKSLTLLAVGGPLNKDAQATIQDVFPDYINVPSTSTDFNRMAVGTQQWVNLVNQMLATAEVMTEFSSLPSGFQRLSRNGVMFLLATFGTIQYLMVPLTALDDLITSAEVGGGSGSGSGS